MIYDSTFSKLHVLQLHVGRWGSRRLQNLSGGLRQYFADSRWLLIVTIVINFLDGKVDLLFSDSTTNIFYSHNSSPSCWYKQVWQYCVFTGVQTRLELMLPFGHLKIVKLITCSYHLDARQGFSLKKQKQKKPWNSHPIHPNLPSDTHFQNQPKNQLINTTEHA